MNREDALRDYKGKIQGLLLKGRQKLEESWTVNEKGFLELLREGVNHVCSALPGPVKYFQFSIIRSLMWKDEFWLMLSVHNEDYFLDQNVKKTLIDAGELFAPLAEVRRELYESVHPYMGKVQMYDADQIIMDTALDFFKKKADVMRKHFVDFHLWRGIEEAPRCSRLVVKWGEHREYSETVFLLDAEERTQEQFLAFNQNNGTDRWDPRYVYQCFDRVHLKDLAVQKKNFLFLGMRRARIEASTWEAVLFAGAGFKETAMEQVIFYSCDLSCCDFRGAELKMVQFIQCRLLEADFRGAGFSECRFEDCEMKSALFSRQELACAGLDAVQLQQIKIEEEPLCFS